MDRSLLLLFFFLLAAAVGHAALSPQLYWHSVLPNTPMPKAISDHLSPDVFEDEKAGTSASVGKGKPGGGVGVNTGRGKKPVTVNVKPGYHSPFSYKYAATDTQLHDDLIKYAAMGTQFHRDLIKHAATDNQLRAPLIGYATDIQLHGDLIPNVTLFFLEKDLRAGAKMNLRFTETTSSATVLPRKEADSIPFSSSKLPAILDQFSIEPNSIEAEAVKETLKACEEPAVGDERKFCATSLESMVDFSTSSLGTHDVNVISTTVGKEGTPAQKYTITASSLRRLSGKKRVVCHPVAYPYAVFYCHATTTTRVYTMEMVGENGTKVEAVAVCHTDTKAWNPGHMAFKLLKVKPGTVPVCHFLPQSDVVWSPSN